MKLLFRTLLLASLGLLAACTAVGERTIVSVGYYKVDGDTFDELDQDIKLHGPNVTGVGKALASTDLKMMPQVRYGLADNGCEVKRARINVNARVTLPRHVNEDKLRDELASAWKNLAEYARIHEAVHLAIADRYALLMESSIMDLPRAKSCAEMRENVQATFSILFKQHHSEQLEFDAAEKIRIRRLIAQNR